MAKDWIKMRMDLSSHPKVVRILSATKSDKFQVVGGLHAVWSVFDVHSEDGTLDGYTPETMDHIIGWDGFCNAMMSVGWLEYDGDETLAMPGFDTHNGQSAKRRADETERKRKERNSADKMRTGCGQTEDKKRSRVEESRVEESKDIDIVISYLNDRAGKSFRGAKADKAMIGQRLKDYGMDCVKSVIDKKAAKWKDDPKMRDYLRPSTLFRPSNFDAYVNEDNKPAARSPLSNSPTADQLAELKRNLGMR